MSTGNFPESLSQAMLVGRKIGRVSSIIIISRDNVSRDNISRDIISSRDN